MAPAGLQGIVFSNELLDAMPVHRLGWDKGAHAWFEWGVACKQGRFVWTRIEDGITVGWEQQSSILLPEAPLQVPNATELLERLAR